LLSGLLFRKGSALPRTPSCQRINNPLDSHFLPPSAYYLDFLYYIAETDMNEDTLWNIFAVTGSVEDYLRYSALRDKKNDNGRGNRS
jgi:hypothetical protein